MLIRYQDFVAHWSGGVLEDVIPVPFVKLSWSWLQIQHQTWTGSQTRRQQIESRWNYNAGVGKLAEFQFPRWWFQRILISIGRWSNDDPIWLILFKWVETTNQFQYHPFLIFCGDVSFLHHVLFFSHSKLQPFLHVLGNRVFWVLSCRKGDQLAIDIGFR